MAKKGDPTLDGQDVLMLAETITPAAVDGFGKIYTKANNELFFQDGGGAEHLLHGDAFSGMWFHNIAAATITISNADTFALFDAWSVIEAEDDLGNLVSSLSTEKLTVGANGGGTYAIAAHTSLTAGGGASKEILAVIGVTLNTAIVITGVTGDTVSPIVVTSVGHGLEDGDMVTIDGVLGNTAADGDWIVEGKDADTFKLYDLSAVISVGSGNYTSGGTIPTMYPGGLLWHRIVSQADLTGAGISFEHMLVAGDAIALYMANLTDTNDAIIAQASISARKIGD